MRAIHAVLILLSLVLTAPSRGQNSPESRATLAGLQGVVVYVDTLSSELPLKGITRDVLRLKVESGLREAGIPVFHSPLKAPLPGDPVLYLGVTTIFDEIERGCVCGIRLELTQTVRLHRNPGYVVFGVPTWGVGGVARYTKAWRDEMIEDVAAFTSEFIDAYYRANPVVGE
jgi:hypothetical protein